MKTVTTKASELLLWKRGGFSVGDVSFFGCLG